MTKFSAGDKVFAKVRGYPPWPARVEAVADATPNRLKYHVLFFGTLETAVCKSQDLRPYAENREKLGKPLKRKYFNVGLAQIEGLELVPDVPRIALNRNSLKKYDVESDAEGTLIIDENPTVKNSKSMKRKRESFDESGEKPTVASDLKSKRGSLPAQKRLKKDSTSSTGESKKNDSLSAAKQEVMSRSGRIIKPKRFADETFNASMPTVLDNHERSALVARITSSDQAGKKYLLMKRVKARRQRQLEFWKEEEIMLKLIEKIKTEFNIHKANLQQGLIHLDALCHIRIEPLMLKKHPDVVNTIEKLVRYTGNPGKWKISKQQKQTLISVCEEVRNKAKSLIDGFKVMFNVPDGSHFHDFFFENVAVFQNKTKDWHNDKINGLIEDPTEKTVKNTKHGNVKIVPESGKSNGTENELQEE